MAVNYVQYPQQEPPISTPVKIAIAAGVIGILYYLLVLSKEPTQPVGPSTPGSPSNPSNPSIYIPPTPATPSGPSTPLLPGPAKPMQPPARPTNMTDCGYNSQPRGWYDIKGRGYRNDFCRFVGDAPIWWSCAVQGELGPDGKPVMYSENGKYAYDPNTPFDPYTGGLTGWSCP